MKTLITLCATTLLLLATQLSAQNNCTSGRYAEPVFTLVDVTLTPLMGYGMQRVQVLPAVWGDLETEDIRFEAQE